MAMRYGDKARNVKQLSVIPNYLFFLFVIYPKLKSLFHINKVKENLNSHLVLCCITIACLSVCVCVSGGVCFHR